jgi:hypothetical protein
LRVGGAGAHAAAGELHGHERHVERRVRAGEFHPDTLRVHVELFGHHHRKPGVDTLAHLALADDHGDRIVGRDPHEGVGGERPALRSRSGFAFLRVADAENQTAADDTRGGAGGQESTTVETRG